jgi:hypothetical protein
MPFINDPRVLLSWEIDPGYCPPIKFSDNQVTICRARKNQYNFFKNSEIEISAWTRDGGYDLYDFLIENSIDTHFDLIIVWSSSASSSDGVYNAPNNLNKFNCPKLLILGDTHHMNKPISTLINYADQELFTHIASIYDRQHLHFFEHNKYSAELGWFPGLPLAHKSQIFNFNKEYSITLLGHSSNGHLVRQQFLNSLKNTKYSVIAGTKNSQQCLMEYSKSLININISLNGDFNLRNYEILMSGGLLLCDKLSIESGIADLLELGVNYDEFESYDHLLYKINYYMQNPNKAVELAFNGFNRYSDQLQPSISIKAVLKWIFEKEILSPHDVSRCSRHQVERSFPRLQLLDRVMLYERLQLVSTNCPGANILIGPHISPGLLFDIVDLKNLNFYIDQNDALKIDILKSLNLTNRFKLWNLPKYGKNSFFHEFEF